MKKLVKVIVLLFVLFSLTNCSVAIKPLTNQDFDVNYKDVAINEKIPVDKITSALGFGIGHEDNNNGLISQGNGLNRWGLHYPGRENSEVEFVYLENYLVFAKLYTISTYRGIKVGDSLDKLFEKYGKGELIEDYYIYKFGGKQLLFYFQQNSKQIKDIIIDYNMEKANKDQGIS